MDGNGAGDQQSPGCSGPRDTEGQARSHTAFPCTPRRREAGTPATPRPAPGCGCHIRSPCMKLTPASPKPHGSDEWQPQFRASHRPTGERNRERNEQLGKGQEATGYVPPNAGQAGTARHRTERWEPQAEGKQQEGTFKPLIKNQPHQTKRRHAGSRSKGPASGTENCLGSIWMLTEQFSGTLVQRGRYSLPWTRTGWPRSDRAGLKAAASACGACGRLPWAGSAQRPWLLALLPLVGGLGCRGLGAPSAGPARRPPLTQLQEPALAVRVEERVRQVVAVVLGDLERLVLDALVQVLRGAQATARSGTQPGARAPGSAGPGPRGTLQGPDGTRGGGRRSRGVRASSGAPRAGGSPAAAPLGGPPPR